MNISAMNIRITILEQTVETDRIGNHRNQEKEYMTCWATASYAGNGTEREDAGTTNPKETVDFTVRWCRALSSVTTDSFRIRADGKLYNILYINPMGHRHRSLKFHCERIKR